MTKVVFFLGRSNTAQIRGLQAVRDLRSSIELRVIQVAEGEGIYEDDVLRVSGAGCEVGKYILELGV